MPLPVRVSMEIKQFTSIREVDQTIAAKFRMTLEWVEQRMTWSDLSNDMNLNILSLKQVHKLWLPTVIFTNTDDNLQTLVDRKTKVLVKKQGNYTKSDRREIHVKAYYRGDENPLQCSREYHYKFNCEFDLRLFPFDTQLCRIHMGKESKRRNQLEQMFY